MRFTSKPDFIVRRGGKREQGRRAQAVQVDLTIDVREKIHRDVSAHAFFIAGQQYVFKLHQAAAVHRENDLVNHVAS